MKFSNGDVVKLKSGGPRMTVIKVYRPFKIWDRDLPPVMVDTLWFDGGGSTRLGRFDQELLIKD